ncbi:hypothetical protein RDI58_007164 [Solanum bulbocastanum]|uniref:Uncharacterized protein n=1 Tax=Solanum bulbocastanum TaxID=147425 RepID=A0AAN8TY91_SOLBU
MACSSFSRDFNYACYLFPARILCLYSIENSGNFRNSTAAILYSAGNS